MIAPTSFDVRLVRAEKISPSVRHLVFERTDGQIVNFEPGQWVNLVMPGADGEIKRSYSIASAPLQSPDFEIAVTRVEGGPGSGFLHAMEVGTVLRAIGPHGLFTRPAGSDAPALMVATGTGVAPFRSMILAALAAQSKTPVTLLFGVRHEADILYRNEFERITQLHPYVHFAATLSRPDSAWTGLSGYVQSHVPTLLQNLSERGGHSPHVLICGLDRMVSAVKDLCRKTLGVDRKRVHTERYD
ncbi:MAG: FAD-dependent oxidoreductase [Polyangiaceae bacterium]|nr:FAD-dependent oxidoreductase [Polyangiaceae bacterium]